MKDVFSKMAIAKSVRGQDFLTPLFRLRETFPEGEVYLVGGAVRDALCDRACVDFDFVVRNISEEALVKWLQATGEVHFVGRDFGVYKWTPAGARTEVDIALPRTERADPGNQGDYRAFAIETNAFLPIVEDLARRDFTMNAIAFEINDELIYDPFSGRKDLKDRVIRAVGEPMHRFQEDYSRMLRAMRFACELDAEIEEKTWRALSTLAPHLQDRFGVGVAERFLGKKGGFVVPRETIGRELVKSLAANLSKTIQLWRESGALAALIPGLRAFFAGNYRFAPVSSQAAIALFLLPLGATLAQSVYKDLTLSDIGSTDLRYLSREELTIFLQTYELLEKGEKISGFAGGAFAQRFLKEHGERLLEFLSEAGKYLPSEKEKAYREELERIYSRRQWMMAHFRVISVEEIPPLLEGEEMKGILQIPGGQELGLWIKKMRDAQLDGEISTKEQARAWLDRARFL